MSPGFRLTERLGTSGTPTHPPGPGGGPAGGGCRLGICASGVAGGPDWGQTVNTLGWANLKARRGYCDANQNPYDEFYNDAVTAAAHDCILIISCGNVTPSYYTTTLKNKFANWDPQYPVLLCAKHEPAGDMSAATWVTAQNAMLDLIGDNEYWFIRPMTIYNGFWWSSKKNNVAFQDSGGFASWWPTPLAQRYKDLQGILGFDAYDAALPPDPAHPNRVGSEDDGPGDRIRNLWAFAKQLPWRNDGVLQPVSGVEMDYIGIGEAGTFDLGNYEDALDATLEYCHVATSWNKSRDQCVLEDSEPRYIWISEKTGEQKYGGNPNAHLFKAKYLASITEAQPYLWGRDDIVSGTTGAPPALIPV